MLLVADAGEQIVGEQHVSVGRGLLRLALGLGVEHDLHQARSRLPAVFRLGSRHVLSPSKELAPTARV